MATSKKRKQKPREPKITINHNMTDYSNDPVFVKKAERAKEIIDKWGIPDHFLDKGRSDK
jgi:hypothetical protein